MVINEGGWGVLGFIGSTIDNDELDFKERQWWKIKGAAEEQDRML